MKLDHQQQVMTTLSGKLQPDVKERDIVSALHPTSAAGGVPSEKALLLIDQWEEFERGWFAAPVGLITREYTEIAVATRACLVEEKEVHLFSGTSLSDGALAWQKWEELENKVQLFLNVFMAGKR